MVNKVYEKTKTFIKENYKTLLLFIVLIFLMTFKLPYYISAPGGLIDTSDRVEMPENMEMKGSLNMAYVTEMDGIIPLLLIALVNNNWDIESTEEVTGGVESIEDQRFRNELLLKEANSTALMVAYENSNIDYSKENTKDYVTFVYPEADTDLEVGDIITEVDGKKIKDKQEIFDLLSTKNIGDKITLKVINDDEEKTRHATLIDAGGEPKIGILVTETFDVESDHPIEITFKNSESGSSGGLMLTLTLYSYLNNIDLTDGKKIVGTGTIDASGNVGEISGIKYKLIGAVKKGADVFIVPAGENYKEAKKVKEEKNYDIKLVPVKTFKEALAYLEG